MVVEAADAGVGRHSLDLSQGLLADGHEVHIVYSRLRLGRQFEERMKRLRGLHAAAVPMRRAVHFSDWSAIRFIRRYLRQHGPFDIVHGHSSKGGALARLATMGRRVPAVYTPNAIRTLNPRIGRAARAVVGGIERCLAMLPGVIIAVSPEEFSHLHELGIPASKIRHVPNCIPEIGLPDRAEARRTLGLSEDGVLLGFVGRLAEQKAPDVLLDAFSTVLETHPRVRLAMIGIGPLDAALRQQAQRLGIADSVHWLGERSGQTSMPAFDVFVLPSRYEGMPYVILEALAAGIPVVTTYSAGASMLVQPGETGELVAADAPDALARAISNLIENAELRDTWAENARRRAGEFSLSRMTSATTEVYRELISRPE